MKTIYPSGKSDFHCDHRKNEKCGDCGNSGKENFHIKKQGMGVSLMNVCTDCPLKDEELTNRG